MRIQGVKGRAGGETQGSARPQRAQPEHRTPHTQYPWVAGMKLDGLANQHPRFRDRKSLHKVDLKIR